MQTEIRSDIQGLRAVAILTVVIYHAGYEFMTGGYVGVDVFFVLSGYLITGLLYREYLREGRVRLLEFYARRIRRLLPASCVVLLATCLLASLLLSPLQQSKLIYPFFSTATYVSNVWFAVDAMEYLGDVGRLNPVLHTWSLSLEEQFYLFWPLIFVISFYLMQRFEAEKRLRLMGFSILLTSFVLSLLVIERSQPWAFFSVFTRAWEFAAGGLICLYHSKMERLSDFSRNMLLISGLGLILFASIWFDESTFFPGFAALVPVIGTVLVIVSGTGKRASWSGLLSNNLMQPLGDLSYSWYMWHWPVQIFFAIAVSETYSTLAFVPPLISLFLAWLTYRWVENPIRFSEALRLRCGRNYLLGGGITGVSVMVIFLLSVLVSNDLNSPEQVRIQVARRDIPQVYQDGCHLTYTGIKQPECEYGEPNGEKIVVLFGDSHAAQWFPVFRRLAQEQGWRFYSWTKSSCSYVAVTPYLQKLKREYRECDWWRDEVLSRIEVMEPDLVITSGFANDWQLTTKGTIRPDWKQGAKTTLERLNRLAKKTLVVHDNPSSPIDIPECLSLAAWQGQALSRCAFKREANGYEIRFQVKLFEQRISEQLDRVVAADFSSAICSQGICQAEIEGNSLFRDKHHLTSFAMDTLHDDVARFLRARAPGLLASE